MTAVALSQNLPRFTPEMLERMPTEDLSRVVEIYRELDQLAARRRIDDFYPESGPHRRELYVKHTEFFRLGATHKERCLLGGNRSGKSVAGAYEVTLHLTGEYPDWWNGYRFDRPIRALIAGDTAKTSRDILQQKMLGNPGAHGTGMIPGDLIVKTSPKSGIPDAVELIHVKHASGGTSICQINSYDQGREAFQGTEQDFVWLDEECPDDVYTEALMRTMTTNGRVILTFTPLSGLTPLVLSFLPEYQPQ